LKTAYPACNLNPLWKPITICPAYKATLDENINHKGLPIVTAQNTFHKQVLLLLASVLKNEELARKIVDTTFLSK
jgi:hypothetical protein